MKLEFSATPAPLRRMLGDFRRYLALLRRFRPYLAPQMPRLGLAAVAAVGYTLVTLIEPWPIQAIFDGVLLRRKVHILGFRMMPHTSQELGILLVGSVLAILVFAALRGQLYYAESVLAATAGQEVVTSVRRELFGHLQKLSLAYHRRARAGDVLMRLTGDIAMLRDMIVGALVSLLSQGLVVVGVLAIMTILNWRLTLVAAAVAPLLFVLLSVFRVRLMEASASQRKREGALASRVHEVLQAVQVVQAYTAERHEKDRFKEMNKRSLHAGLRSTRLEATLHRNVQVAIAAGVAATLGLGANEVIAGRLSPGQLLVFMAYVRGLYGPLRQLSKMTQRTARAAACGDRVLEVLEEEPGVADAPDAVDLPAARGRITFTGVSFAYDSGPPVLRDLDLDIEPCETVAVVGPTGAGKTTLLDLIPRFFDPQEGEVSIDGIPVRALRLKSLRRQISYLSQETVVMGLTVRENIAYGALAREGPPPEPSDIERVARAARAHDFILELPQGYDTVLEERGSTLSGGQRQRIAIARALLRNARILLLDEPMTGLDPVSERAVLEALEILRRGRTTLVVAHDMSTVLHADRIVFLKGGRLVEQGTHEELLARVGPYAAFFRAQWGALAARAPEATAGPAPGRRAE